MKKMAYATAAMMVLLIALIYGSLFLTASGGDDREGWTDLRDPYENILVGVDFLEELFWKYEDPAAVLMYYNAGHSERYGIGAWQNGDLSQYADQILERAAELERIHGK